MCCCRFVLTWVCEVLPCIGGHCLVVEDSFMSACFVSSLSYCCMREEPTGDKDFVVTLGAGAGVICVILSKVLENWLISPDEVDFAAKVGSVPCRCRFVGV